VDFFFCNGDMEINTCGLRAWRVGFALRQK
jgi:hypothetical protein